MLPHEVFLEITTKVSPQGTPNLWLLHFVTKTNVFLTLLVFFLFILFIWTFLPFLFDFITDADYKHQQWFRSSWKQNLKVVKHMAHMLCKHFHFIIVSMKIWNVWIMLEVVRIQQAQICFCSAFQMLDSLFLIFIYI